MSQVSQINKDTESKSKSKDTTMERLNNLAEGKLTPAQCTRLLDYIKRKKNGENLPDFVLNHPMTKEEAKNWEFKFWNNRLVPKINETAGLVSIIDPEIKATMSATIQQQMYEPYYWTEWIETPENKSIYLNEVVEFLNKYYENDCDEFRCHYSTKYLKWNLGDRFKIIGIKTDSKIGAVIAYSIKKMQVFQKEVDVADVNYLCIHPKLREKNLAPRLIDEVIRRAALDNVIVGIFGTNKYIPNPFCKIEFYNRPLNYERLYHAGYIKLERNVSLDKAVATTMLQNKNKQRVIKMEMKHYQTVYQLLNEYQDRFNIYRKYTFDEFVHTFRNSDVVSSYVILSDEDEYVLDFFSFYKLPYSVVKYKKDNNTKMPEFINAAYMNMYTSINVTQLIIFKAALLAARDEIIDIFISPDTMESLDIMYDNVSKFTKSSKYLHYNFYNMKCPETPSQQICL